MKNRSILYIIAAAILLLYSCEKEMHSDAIASTGKGEFLSTNQMNLSLDVTTRSHPSGHTMLQSRTENMELSVYEEEWTSDLFSTKANVTGDEVQWDMEHPNLALYITNTTDETLLKGNIPYNAETHYIYYDWHSTKKAGVISAFTNKDDDLNIQNVNSKSYFFWDTWTSRPADMPDNVNFYGYYPRAADGGNESDNLYYYPTSIIDRTSANKTGNDWNILDFSFYSTQTIENLSHHDVMYSIPEHSTDIQHRAGNRDKGRLDNIQLHFVHAFCLFDVSITKGATYTGPGKVSKITLRGDEVYNTGKLNIGVLGDGEQRITPGQKGMSVVRSITDAENNTSGIFETTMIIPPLTVAKGNDEALRIICDIDGCSYSCPIVSPDKDMVFKEGTKYSINLTLAPDGVVIVNVWDGGSITIDGQTYEKEAYIPIDFDKEYDFTAAAKSGYKVYSVLYNGVEADKIVKEKGLNKIYNVVVLPESGWYSTNDNYKDLSIHFDAKQHDKCYGLDNMSESQNPNVWSDLSGHGNDGILQSFDNTPESGWQENGNKGLAFDGSNDIVKYPGQVNSTSYTFSFLVKIEVNPHENRSHYRLNAEGIEYPSYYINTTLDNKYEVSIYGHEADNQLGILDNNGDAWIPVDKGIIQLDFVYNGTDYPEKRIYVYVNGNRQTAVGDLKGYFVVEKDAVSIDEASLGGRILDNSRSMKGTYYSFMLYDRALSDAEIMHNFNINKNRYSF